MNRLTETRDKLMNSEIKYSWIYLLYIYLLLPLVLFVLAWALRSTGFGATLGVMFHNYGLFVASPIPSSSLTGIVGLVIAVIAIVKAVLRRNWLDAGICVVLSLANAVYFALELNYLLLPFILISA